MDLGRSAEAVQRIKRVMDQQPLSEVWPRVPLAYVYEMNKPPQYDQAVEAISKGLLGRPDWDAGYVYLADIYDRENQRDEARKWLKQGLAKVPGSVPISARLATLEIDAGQPQAAEALLLPLVQQFEKLNAQGSPDKLDRLGAYKVPVRLYSLALYNEGRAQEAVAWGMKLWDLDPTDVANANNMAWVLATAFNRLDQAEEMIRQSLKVVPNHPQVLDTAGWIAFLRKRYQESMDYFTASIKYGDNAQAHYHMGCLLQETDRPSEARAQFVKALEMGLPEKDKQDIKKRLERLPG